MEHRKLFLALIVIVGLFLPVHRIAYAANSNELKQRTTKDENIIRVDYVDENGIVTFASDKRYATVVKTLDENENVVQEFYYDEQGAPALQKNGYYGAQREYDEAGRNNVVVFLDAKGIPVMSSSGYAKRVRTYDVEGKVKTEFYYDAEGRPTACSQGYWGYRKEEGRTVYLGPWGIPIILPHIIQKHPWAVAAAALLLLIIPVFLSKKAVWLLLTAYIVFMVYMTLLFRQAGSSRGHFELFQAYRTFFTSKYTRQQIIYNILLFVPLGSMIAAVKGRRSGALWLLLLLPAILSFTIECTQYMTGLGTY